MPTLETPRTLMLPQVQTLDLVVSEHRTGRMPQQRGALQRTIKLLITEPDLVSHSTIS